MRKPAAPIQELEVDGDQFEGGVLRGLLFAIPIGLTMWGAVGVVIWLLWP